MTARAADTNEPWIGLFWFIATDGGSSRFTALSRPFSEVAEVAGFKTLEEGHVDVWTTLQRRHPAALLYYEYEHFPRGRVNWRREDDKLLLLLDPKLNRDQYIDHVANSWSLPKDWLLVLPGRHYRSSARVGPPLPEDGKFCL